MLKISMAYVLMEEDEYQNGCNPETATSYDYELKLRANTRDLIIKEVCEHFDVKEEDLSLNACDEDGRIDIQELTDSEGIPLSAGQIEQWKRGELKGYNKITTVYVESVNPFKL